MSIQSNRIKVQIKCLLIALLLLVCNRSIAQNDSVKHTTRVVLYAVPSDFLDPIDGSSIRLGLAYYLPHDLSVSLDGAGYLHHQPSWDTKSNIHGFMLRPMIKYNFGRQPLNPSRKKFKGAYNNYYFGVELMVKHQTYGYNDSIVINNAPPFNKAYTINRYAAGIHVLYGQTTMYKKGLIIDYYGGVGFRFKHTTSSLTADEENGILTGENHGDIIGDAQRSIGNNYLPVILWGVKIEHRLL